MPRVWGIASISGNPVISGIPVITGVCKSGESLYNLILILILAQRSVLCTHEA